MQPILVRTRRRSLSRTGAFAVVALSALALAAGVGISATATASESSKVKVELSNRSRGAASCKATGVTHIFVTISDIKAHRSGKGNAGFVSLTSGAPQQFDLLFSSNEPSEAFDMADCPIVSMGGTGLPPGKYQQLSMITVANGSGSDSNPIIPAEENACSSLGNTVYNCVDTGSGLSPLTVPSGPQTGIKIPASQISRGGFSVVAGQGLDLDVDVDACRSLVVHGPHGQVRGSHGNHGKHGRPSGSASYMFKPVLHAGEVALQPIIVGNVVAGTVSSGKVTAGTTVVPNASVFLETEPSAPNVPEASPTAGTTSLAVNDVVAEATTDSDGNFAFCPVPVGTYDIVIDSQKVPESNNASDATITTGVTVAASGGPNDLVIPVVAGSTGAATLSPQVTTTSASPPGTGDDIAFQGTQGFGTDSANQAPIPLFSGSALSPVATASNGCSSACPSGTNCACFTIVMPPDNPVTGAAGETYTAGATGTNYSLFGAATKIGSTTPECTQAELVSAPHASPLPTPTLSFTGCN